MFFGARGHDVHRARRRLRVLRRALRRRPQRGLVDPPALRDYQHRAVARDAFDHGVFAANGGFLRLNKTFDGQLEVVLSDFHERIWQDAAA